MHRHDHLKQIEPGRLHPPSRRKPTSSTVLYMSMSLDEFITGPNASMENPLGDGGERLHKWIFPVTYETHHEAAAEAAQRSEPQGL